MLLTTGTWTSTCNAAFSYQNLAINLCSSVLRLNSTACVPSSFTCCRSNNASVPVVTASEPEKKSGGVAKSLAEELRFGSLAEDGLSYKEKFIVRCYEVGINKTATVETMANYLQEVACNHAQTVGFSTDGFSTTTTMRRLNLIWVTARMHIEVYKYPAWSDVVEIETWGQSEGRIGTRRDWIIRDYSNGEVIGRATSKWVMMHHDSRRFQKVSDEVRDEYLVFCPKTPRFAFPEEDNYSLRKISKLEDPALFSSLGLAVRFLDLANSIEIFHANTEVSTLQPRRVDLDMNQHVNNVAYIGWILESIPQEVINTHELQTITLDYRRECQHDDIVDSLTSPESEENAAGTKLKVSNGYASAAAAATDGDDLLPFLHMLRLSNNKLEINRARTRWRKKTKPTNNIV